MGLVDRRQEAYDKHPEEWVKVGTIPDDVIRKWPFGEVVITRTLTLCPYWKELAKQYNLRRIVVTDIDDLRLNMPVFWRNDMEFTLAWVVKRELLRKGKGAWYDRMIRKGQMSYFV